MNVISIIALAIVMNLVLIGCSPVKVSLNSEFGLTSSQSPSDEPDASNFSILTEPPYANSSTSSDINYSGTCKDMESIQISVNQVVEKTVACTDGSWAANLDLQTEPDGSIEILFADPDSEKKLKKVTLQKDTVSPTAALNSFITSLNNASTLLIDVNELVGASQYSYKLGETVNIDCSSSTGYSVYHPVAEDVLETLSADGNYRLCLIGKDAFENEQAYSSATVIDWQRDTVLPSLSLSSSTSAAYVNASTINAFSVTVNCSEPGRAVQFKAADQNLLTVMGTTTCAATLEASYTYSLSSLAEGSITFSSSQTDAAGNLHNAVVLNAVKDTIAPLFSTTTVNDGTYYSSIAISPNITWTAATDVGGSGVYEYQLGFGTSSSSPNHTAFFSVGIDTSRQHTFTNQLTDHTLYYAFVRAYDNAGNTTVILSDGWRPDTTAPLIASVTDGSSGIPGTSPAISWVAGAESGSGIQRYEVSIGTSAGGTNIINWTAVGLVNTTILSNSALTLGGGPYYASVRAIDNANNTGPSVVGDGFFIKPTLSQIASNSGAFAGIMTDGKVVAWGDISYGGSYLQVPSSLKTGPLVATAIKASNYAFAVITNDGAVHAWGSSGNGGNSSSISTDVDGTIDVTSLFSTGSAFAALRSDGRVLAWGSASAGGYISPAVSAELQDAESTVQNIVSTSSAFAALKSDGSVVAWGNTTNGGDTSSVANEIDGSIPVVELSATSSAFIARRSDGSVVSWGYFSGILPSSLTAYLDGSVPVTKVFTNGVSAAAIRNDGSMITWGESAYGGDSSSVQTEINGTVDVTYVYANPNSFAALRSDGSVITWGNSISGGVSSSTAASRLTGYPHRVTSVSHTNTAYAAILENGSVATWGSSTGGGYWALTDTNASGAGQITSIVGSSAAFAAIRSDGSVVTWGNSDYGGDSSSVSSRIDGSGGAIVKLYSNPWSFIAVYADGRFVTWGETAYGGDSSTINPD